MMLPHHNQNHNQNHQYESTIDATSTTTNNTTYKYSLHSLTESDIPAWADFCASCFSYKKPNPPPSTYFSNHYFHDPRRDANLLCVIVVIQASPPTSTCTRSTERGQTDATHSSGEECECDSGPESFHHNVPVPSDAKIIASTRIFSRKISLGKAGKSVEAGGIGEVCTDASHRKKGLAKRLLMNAIALMQQQQQHHHENSNINRSSNSNYNMSCSMLHAAPALMNVYERSAGYKGVDSYWKVIHFSRDAIAIAINTTSAKCQSIVQDGLDLTTTTTTTTRHRLASFPKDTSQLQKIHKEYSEDRFAGCIIRSIDYWNEYICKEIGDSLFVLCINDTSTADSDRSDSDSDKIVAWMSIRKRSNRRFQLRDFGCCSDTCARENILISTVFYTLLQQSLKTYLSSSSDGDDNDELERDLELAIPSMVHQDLESIDWAESVSEECDDGWMYKDLEIVSDCDCEASEQSAEGAGAGAGVDMPYIVNELKVPHLIWPADSF
jgi:ribosomal protein S18 acetylase RimI-like enzyme